MPTMILSLRNGIGSSLRQQMAHFSSAGAPVVVPQSHFYHNFTADTGLSSGLDMDVSIIDKDETSDSAYHVVDGFVIEDSKKPFPQNGQLSFVPEEYGKEKPPPHKKTRQSTNTPKHSRNVSPDITEMHTCEYCKLVAPGNQFLAPSRRFCSMSCCKRYSAEKRYYPYGKDEEGIAKAIREGLVNPNGKSVRQAAPGAKQSKGSSLRDQRRRKMASFSKDKGTPNGGSPSKSLRGKRSRQTPTITTSSPHISSVEKKAPPTESSPMEVYAHPTGMPLHSWAADDVSEFLTFLGYEAYIDRFLEHEIDGRALSLIKDHHLLMTLKLRLGPTLKICQQVNAIKAMDEVSDTE